MSSTSRALLVVSALLCVGAVGWFAGRQNAGGKLGGRISWPKRVWLTFTIWSWLFECAVLALDAGLPFGFRLLVGVHAASMWTRGLLELVMLYRWKNWKPPYGIAHDALCIVSTGALAAAFSRDVGPAGPLGWWAPAFVGMLVFALGVELIYAALFFKAVKGKTTGDDATWFAAEDEARFRRINRLTTALNVPQVAFQAAFVLLA
ncbi:MAG: hypothetical protein AB1938_21340 [Myxococcota bacterium]